MTKKLQDRLFKRFNNMFRERYLPMSQTCMCWGIDCGDGWFDLLCDLCEKLKNNRGCGIRLPNRCMQCRF